MNERTLITLLVAGLLLLGGGIFCYYYLVPSSFTFSSVELEFRGNAVREKLTFVPDKPYHTLYRNFITKIRLPGDEDTSAEFIRINSVECSEGMPYYNDYEGWFISNITKDHNVLGLGYTQPNEFGCGFDNELGFKEGVKYTVAAEYSLNPTKLYESGGKHYIKFVAYEKSRHPLLEKGKNFFIKGDAFVRDWILPGIETVVYIPYEPENLDNYEILTVDRLNITEGIDKLILLFIVLILPAIACLVVWLIFGKEKSEGDYPSELSQYPVERKAWEVSVYFHPPFGALDNNFLPAMILDFYSREIIDLEFREGGLFAGKDVFIKILKSDVTLDESEAAMLGFLKLVEAIEKPKDGFFSIKQASKKFSGFAVTTAYRKFGSAILKKSKDYLDYKGNTIIRVILVICLFLQIVFGVKEIFVYIPLVITGIVCSVTSLFIRFKGDYYLEFQKWEGFRKYLSNSDSMKRSPPTGVVMWEKYLIYATALGVGKKVLSEMKALNMIDSKEYDNFSFIYTSNAFGTISSSGGGGGGGLGGGGVGGGGGGGR